MKAGRVIKNGGAECRPFDWQDGGGRIAKVTPPGGAPSYDAPAIEADANESYQRGLREGEASVRAGFEAAVVAMSGELAKAVAAMAAARATLLRDAQADLLKLSIAIARRILHRELLVSPDVVGGIISVVLDKLDRQEVQRVRVHPSMAQRFGVELERLAQGREIQVTGDAGLPLGGCVFETLRGNIDAGMDSQLSEIERGLADRLGPRR